MEAKLWNRSMGPQPSPQALLQTGVQMLQQGRVQEAWNTFHEVLRRDPTSAPGHHMVGLLALQTGQLEAGVRSLQRSIALDPTDPAAYSNLANGLRDLGRTDEALQAYGEALAMAPSFLNALNNRAILFGRLGRFDEALADCDRALAQDGRLAFLHNQRAVALRNLGRHAEALDSCAAALRLDPRYADAHLNRGNVLAELGRDAEAIADYEACLALNPARLEALYYSGVARLALGDYERGWERYEARLRLRGRHRVASDLEFTQPAWRGETSLQGRTILLHSEQGLGDTLQFCRYADLAKAAGASVILQVDAPLVRLLSTLRGVDGVLAKGASLPRFDAHAPVMSLPLAFGTTLQTIPAEIPYLRAEPEKIAVWARRLGPRTRPRVGLVWSGGVVAGRAEFERRNMPLRMLAPLAAADVDFVSLQKGEAAERELAQAVAAGWNGPAMVDPAADLHDFSDTAALIETLDLVITVDTSTAHLAGALGKPVWILNRFDSCWRWLRQRTDSPWYPTARLFRQRTFGDWSGVAHDVAEALQIFQA
jgi:tetratricopeptide (TPR) repeat protein